MTSKVLVKLPVVPFAQRKKPMPEIIAVPSRKDDTTELVDETKSEILNCDKITQLEQNVKFLQDQHQITLIALHQEVEVLRQKNRDLQFQLVFSKGSNSAMSSPSSPEDTGGSLVKPKQDSPGSINVTPLQVELLEKDLQDVKSSLNEARKRNVYLSEVIEKQKKSLELAEKVKEELKRADVAVQAESMLECQQVEMKARLDDAEMLVHRLRQENEEQRKEIANLKSSSAHSSTGSRHGSSRNRGFQNSYHNRSMPNDIQGQDENYQKFPPLQTQSYWHRGSRGNRSNDHNAQSDYHHSSGKYQDGNQDQEIDHSNTALPQLRKGSVRIDNSSSYPPFYRSRDQHSGGSGGGANSGTYYKDDRGSRKYRGQKPQRERRDQDGREYHREYREPKDNQRQYREYSDNPKGSRDYRNAQGHYE